MKSLAVPFKNGLCMKDSGNRKFSMKLAPLTNYGRNVDECECIGLKRKMAVSSWFMILAIWCRMKMDRVGFMSPLSTLQRSVWLLESLNEQRRAGDCPIPLWTSILEQHFHNGYVYRYPGSKFRVCRCHSLTQSVSGRERHHSARICRLYQEKQQELYDGVKAVCYDISLYEPSGQRIWWRIRCTKIFWHQEAPSNHWDSREYLDSLKWKEPSIRNRGRCNPLKHQFKLMLIIVVMLMISTLPVRYAKMKNSQSGCDELS